MALHPRNRVTMAKLDAVETPDEHTAIFRLSQPAPYLLSILNGGESQVVPQHVYDGQDVAKNMIDKSPIGTGPFKLKEWRKGQAIILERNPDYWQAGKPYLDGISFRVIQDEGARATAFETGEVQYGVLNPVSPCAAKRLSSLPNIEIDKRGYQFFGTRYLLELNLRNPIMADKRVRQALAHAIDRQFILKNIWCGNGTLSTGPVPPQLKQFYTADVATYDFDPKKAEELLDAAGYKRDANGIRFKMTHDPLPFGPDYMRTAEVMKQNLKAVGIDVEIRSQDTPTWLRRIYTDNDFDMTSNTLSALPDPTLGVQRVYWSKNIVKGVPFSNSSVIPILRWTRCWRLRSRKSIRKQRKQLFYTMQKIAQDDLPVIDIFVADWNTVHAKNLKNVTTTADGYSTLADAYFEN